MNTRPRRKESRIAGERMGEIKLGLFKRIECAVSDLSSSGAKLTTDEGDKLPETFNISISGTGKRRKHKCIKRWQDGNVTGVEFVFE